MCPYVEDFSRTSDLQIVNELVHPDHGLVASPLPHNMEIAGSKPLQVVTPRQQTTQPLFLPPFLPLLSLHSPSHIALSHLWLKASSVLQTPLSWLQHTL